MAALFCLIAVLYSMVGFGGGSSYIALMVLLNIPYELVPKVALVCNLIVVTGGVIHFVRRGHFKMRLFWPFIVSSIPMAYVGGRLEIDKQTFLLVLGFCLLLAALRLLLADKFKQTQKAVVEKAPVFPAILVGGILGLVSGMVGIGGGIFLSPILLNLRWGRPKEVAATASMFIFVNSLSGLMGQFVKNGEFNQIIGYWPVFIAVLVGGQIGSYLGSAKLQQQAVKFGTALLVLFVGLRLLYPYAAHFMTGIR